MQSSSASRKLPYKSSWNRCKHCKISCTTSMQNNYWRLPVLKLQRSSFSSCNNSFQNGSSNESSCQNKRQHCNSST